MRWLDVDGARLHLSDGQTKRNEKTQTDEPLVSRKTVYTIVKAGMRVAPRGDSGAEARVVDARGVAIEMLAASEADLRAALVDLAERASGNARRICACSISPTMPGWLRCVSTINSPRRMHGSAIS